jgi:hypothetical protein
MCIRNGAATNVVSSIPFTAHNCGKRLLSTISNAIGRAGRPQDWNNCTPRHTVATIVNARAAARMLFHRTGKAVIGTGAGLRGLTAAAYCTSTLNFMLG